MKGRSLFCAVSMFLLLIAHSTVSSAQRFVRAPIYSAGNPTVSVATGDFNGDGTLDLAFLSTNTPAVITIRLGIGNGKFNQGQQITLSGAGYALITGDWNNDGVRTLLPAWRAMYRSCWGTAMAPSRDLNPTRAAHWLRRLPPAT